MYATGRNGYGQLGLQDLVDRDVLTEVLNSSPQGTDWLYVVCGAYHSLAFRRGALAED